MAYFTPPLLQRLIDLRFGEGGVGTKHHLLAQRLLPLNLRQEKFFPVLGTVHVPGRSFAARQSPSRLNSNSG